MFSAHLPRINTVPREVIYFVTGVALLVSLLIAIASVASGEVKKAAMRDSALASQRSAAAYCVETRRGAALNSCLRLAWADSGGEMVQDPGTGNALPRSVAADDITVIPRGVTVANVSGQGFMLATPGGLR